MNAVIYIATNAIVAGLFFATQYLIAQTVLQSAASKAALLKQD